ERDEGAAQSGMGAIKSKAGRVHRLLNFLADQDKMWDSDRLVSYTRSLFISFNVAMETDGLDSLKDNLDPELLAKYEDMADSLGQKGEKMERRNLAVRDVEIVLVKNYYDNSRDSFTAWVSGQAQTVIADGSGTVVQGDDHVADFEEFWTFRRNGTKWVLIQ